MLALDRISEIQREIDSFADCSERIVPLGTKAAAIKIGEDIYPVYINGRYIFEIWDIPRAASLAWLQNGKADDVTNISKLPRDLLKRDSLRDKLKLEVTEDEDVVIVKGSVFCFHYINGEYLAIPKTPVRLVQMEKPDNLGRFLSQLQPVQNGG